VGFALKVHQRAWSLLRGVAAIEWTFDPLVRRNAYFNIVKLAALPDEYLDNFYGDMHDAINGDDDSDRILVRWQLDSPAVIAACVGSSRIVDVQTERARGAEVALSAGGDGRPEIGRTDAETLLVAVPPDIESMRANDPAAAKHWRVAVRESLGTLLVSGARVTGFDRTGWYIVQRGLS
jgi:predicted GNAT superfamily acetyltransferase